MQNLLERIHVELDELYKVDNPTEAQLARIDKLNESLAQLEEDE